MSRFTHLLVGPWPHGMARPERGSDIPPTALFDAVNVDVRPEGSVATARGWEQVLAAANCHSMYYHRGTVYGVVDGQLSVLSESGAQALMPVSGALSWTDVGGVAHFATRDAVWRVREGVCTQVSTANRDPDDFDDALAPLPGGQWLEYWNGRLLVARGAVLVFSQPLRYGTYNPMTDYIALGRQIEWVAPLETGIYVGTIDKVYWIDGTQPSEFRVREVAGKSAPGMAAVVPAEALGRSGAARYAVFFTPSGFAVGDASGAIEHPQAERFADLPLYRGKLFVENTRIFAVRA